MSFTFVSLNNVDTNGMLGDVFTFDRPKSKVTMHCIGGGASLNVWLQLSLDGVNFFDAAEALAGSPVVTSDDHIGIAARARVSNLSAGTNITAIIGVEPTETGINITQS